MYNVAAEGNNDGVVYCAAYVENFHDSRKGIILAISHGEGEEEGLDNEGARNFNVNRFHLV